MASQHNSMINLSSTPVMQSWFGVDIVFQWGPFKTSSFKGRARDYQPQVFGQEIGLEVKVVRRTILLPADSLLINGHVVDPKTGNRLIVDDEIYEISPPDNDTPSVKSMVGGFEWEVHAKQIR